MLFAQSPDARADEEETERNDEGGGGRHESIGDDAVVEGVAGGSQDGKRRHIRAEKRQQEDVGAEGAAGDEEFLGLFAVLGCTEGEDSDVQDDGQVDEDEDGGNQGRLSSSEGRFDSR